MGLMKELNDLNNIYQKMYEGKKADKDYDGDGKVESGSKEHAGVVHNAIQKKKGGKADGKDTRSEAMVVTNADKKANTKAYQNYKKGMKNKKGEPVYKAADHLKDEVEYEVDEGYGKIKTPEKLVAKVRQPKKGAAPKGSKMKEEYSDKISPEVEKLIESGLFSDAEIAKIADIQEADIADILARLEKKRISKGGDPEESPLPAMKKYHADKKKKAKK